MINLLTNTLKQFKKVKIDVKVCCSIINIVKFNYYVERNYIFLSKNNQNKAKDSDDYNFERKYLTECKLSNEIIDRSTDLERQCYYECDENDIVRVDTSIEYICQPFILEKR